jgi:hypothetical protein
MTRFRKLSTTLLLLTSIALAGVAVASAPALADDQGGGGGDGGGGGGGEGGATPKDPIAVQRMGHIFAGGTLITAPGVFDPTNPNPFGAPAGQTLHADAVYAQYKIPAGKPRALPLVMWHGCLSPAWESTPDGREGFESIFLRRGWSTYVIDWPRMGRSGKSSQGVTITPAFTDQAAWDSWRLGVWPNFFPNSQFPQGADSVDQFFRAGGNSNGPSNNSVSTDAVAALFNKIGPAILLTHSASGLPGLLTAIKSSNVKAIIAYDPNEGVFPTGEVPPPMANAGGLLMYPTEVSPSDFDKLTKIPIRIQFGDFIPTSPDPSNVARDNWRVRMANNQQFVDTINRHGGDAVLVKLPDLGIFGNSHFSFTDLNNIQIADLLSHYLRSKGLDKK